MATTKIVASIYIRWWVLQPYTQLLLFFSLLTGQEPDWQKVNRFIRKYCISVGKPK